MTAKSARNEKRRTNKPLMEKRRRARINHSLAVLKSMIIKDETEASTSQSRLEKADILELTVMHLRSLESKKSIKEEPINKDVSYQLGYQTCCQDIERFLSEDPNPSKEKLMQLLSRKAESTSSAVVAPVTRLPDGRLALILMTDSTVTPPSSPAQAPQQPVLLDPPVNNNMSSVWRPWF